MEFIFFVEARSMLKATPEKQRVKEFIRVINKPEKPQTVFSQSSKFLSFGHTLWVTLFRLSASFTPRDRPIDHPEKGVFNVLAE